MDTRVASEVIRLLKENNIEHHVTGSYYIGGFDEEFSDIDIAIYADPNESKVSPFKIEEELREDVSYGGSGGELADVESWKMNYHTGIPVNLIYIKTKKKYDTWINARNFAWGMDMQHKQTRVTWFEMCRAKGETFGEASVS